ncbi:MAG: RNA methyltransferase [Eubacteriales bacterium]|nr:RNA methyltransferase [Eubacteriales bacterium]
MVFFDEVITSKSNRNVINTALLHDKKYRDLYCTFIAEGKKLFIEAVDCNVDICAVYIAESKKKDFSDMIYGIRDFRYAKTPVYTVSDDCFSKISTEKAPQGIITVIKYLDNYKKYNIINIKDEEKLSDKAKKSLMLYDMQDPGNLGSVIRSAAALGAERIIMSSGCADVFNTKTVRAAMGSLFRVELIEVSDFSGTVASLKKSGRRIFAAELTDNAVSLDSISLLTSDIVIIGNEGHGIPKDISSACDRSLYIPIKGGVESLNASVAAAIIMYAQK